MSDKIKNIITTVLLSVIIFGLGITLIVSKDKEYSDSERRTLAQMPDISIENLFKANNGFMSEFETYTLDQFPYRDTFRKIKMFTSLRAFFNLTANGLYTFDGAIVKEEYPLKLDVVSENLDTLATLYETTLKDKVSSINYALVPDKNYYYSKESDRLYFDWNELESLVAEKLYFGEYIDITDTLTKDSYYLTDTHWSQDKITSTADKISSSLGVELPKQYTENTLPKDFWGVYTNQLMLKTNPDKLIYLTNDTINSFKTKVTNNYGVFVDSAVYDENKRDSKDLYDFFLSGAVSLATIENPSANNDKHLIVFRDSFGSSISPLLAQGYAKTTVVDIRYVNVNFLSSLVDFENADVLFIYCPLVLNSPKVFKTF